MVTESPRILVVIPTLHDDPSQTIASIRNQTIRVQSIMVVCGSEDTASKVGSRDLVKALFVEPRGTIWGKSIAHALNEALKIVELTDYDYFLRVDADTILPPNFLRDNIRLEADLVGEAGYAMLIRTQPFVEVAEGRFKSVLAEDTYLTFMFKAYGKKVELWATPPEVLRTPGTKKPWRFYFLRGKEMYQLGYEPVHVLGNVVFQRANLLAICGYTAALLKGTTRYTFARRIFSYQLASLGKDVKDALRGRKFVRRRNANHAEHP